jgi:hypothetical protein
MKTKPITVKITSFRQPAQTSATPLRMGQSSQTKKAPTQRLIFHIHRSILNLFRSAEALHSFSNLPEAEPGVPVQDNPVGLPVFATPKSLFSQAKSDVPGQP